MPQESRTTTIPCGDCTALVDLNYVKSRVLPTWAATATQPSSGEHFVDAGCGGADGEDSFECIFAPLSSTCSTAHAGEHNSVYHPRLPSFNQSDVGPVCTTSASPTAHISPAHPAPTYGMSVALIVTRPSPCAKSLQRLRRTDLLRKQRALGSVCDASCGRRRLIYS